MAKSLEAELKETFGDNLWQYGEFEISSRVQIVVKMKPKKVLGLDYYSRKDALKLVGRILEICKKYPLPYDLRLCLKLQTNITVTDMEFTKQSISNYKRNDKIEEIASHFHIVSGLK